MLRISTFDTSRPGSELAPEPIDPSWIKEGAPVARAARITESRDKDLIAGLWDCTAGTFRWIYWFDEVVHILEGEVRVSDGVRTQVLVPGSVAYFPSGLESVWEVPTYVKKMFILRAPPQSPIRRVASAVKRRLVTLTGRGRP